MNSNIVSAAKSKAAEVQVGLSSGQKIFSECCHPIYGIFFSSDILKDSVKIFLANFLFFAITSAIITIVSADAASVT